MRERRTANPPWAHLGPNAAWAGDPFPLVLACPSRSRPPHNLREYAPPPAPGGGGRGRCAHFPHHNKAWPLASVEVKGVVWTFKGEDVCTTNRPYTTIWHRYEKAPTLAWVLPSAIHLVAMSSIPGPGPKNHCPNGGAGQGHTSPQTTCCLHEPPLSSGTGGLRSQWTATPRPNGGGGWVGG